MISRRYCPLMMVVWLGATALAGCQSQGVLSQENNLTAEGFTVRIADTAARQAMLNSLPAHRFVQRVSGDSVQYVYADPLVCGCLYIGTQDAFDRYVTDQRLDMANAQEMALLNYYDASWNWDAWGPWGPLGPIYGPGW